MIIIKTSYKSYKSYKIFMKKYQLGICELFNKYIHGYDESSANNIIYHYLVYDTIELDEFYDNSFIEYIHILSREYHNYRANHLIHTLPITNYVHIIKKQDYIKPEIIHISKLNGNEEVACIKTFWIRILQKKWKKYYKQKQKLIQQRKTIFAINYRNIYGKWPLPN